MPQRFIHCLTILLFTVIALPFAHTVVAEDDFVRSEEFDQRIRDYLLENPEVIMESVQRFQVEQQRAQADRAQQAVLSRRDEIFNNPDDPVAGNPAGDVTVVEFMDYNCPYCRKAYKSLLQLTKDDPNIKLLFKEMPVLGEGSEFAARAALAAQQQNLYMAFHNALMEFNGRLNEQAILSIAEQSGLNVDQLKQDMTDPKIQATIDRNMQLAQALGVRGTPAFVIGDEVVRGAADLNKLKQSVAKARKADK
ncbi:MAG: DsbA family protein [Candidatus Competibacteraceae bacterium]|jgi:protein-disulfide isomerase|nr:DsbA family protein [Candidatus Competibacteraceae bacterium]